MSTAVKITCTKCGETKPETDFNRCKNKLNGRDSYCKACKSEYDRARHLHNFFMNKTGKTVPPESKRCPKCATTKSASEFHRNATTKSGLHSWCKSCGQKPGMLRRKRLFWKYFHDNLHGKTVTPKQKWCPGCKHMFEANEFACSRNTKDGLNSCCKTCRSERGVEHYATHKAEAKACRERRLENPRNRETLKNRAGAWHARNRSHLNAKARALRAAKKGKA